MSEKRKVMVFENRQWNGNWQKTEKGIAEFHQFGVDFIEFDNGPGNFSSAIIEWPDGTVENVPADCIQFLKE